MQKHLPTKNTFDPPPEIQQLAKREELGELRKIYNVAKANTPPFAIGFICTMFSGFLILFFILSIISPVHSSGLTTGFGLSGFILLVTGLYLILSRGIYSRWHVYLWQYGFIYEKKQAIQAFHWNQIESVQRNPLNLTTIVRRQDGHKLKIGPVFLDILELVDIVLEKSIHQFTPPEFRMTPSESIRTFGTFKIDRQGISNEQETLLWEEIREFTIKGGGVTLLKKEEEPNDAFHRKEEIWNSALHHKEEVPDSALYTNETDL
jgi:hypothetical protein